MLNDREILLERVQNGIADKACKAMDYDLIGKPTKELYYDIMVLRNFEFLLCGSEIVDCDKKSCLDCKISQILKG